MTIEVQTAQSPAIACPSDPEAPARYSFAVMRRRFRILPYILAVLLALTPALQPAAPARADILACVNFVVPPLDDAMKAGELAANLSDCAGEVAGGNVLMATVIAFMAVLAVADFIPTQTDACFTAIDQVIGTALAAVLGPVGVPDAELNDLKTGALSLHELAETVPILLAVLHYVNCGCYVIGAPEEIKELTEKFLADVKACGDALAGGANALADVVEAIGCTSIEFSSLGLLGCSAAGGGDQKCYTSAAEAMVEQFPGTPESGHCELGMQCNQCGWSWCGTVPHAVGIAPGICACPAAYTSNYG
jgi:hypothetical protein